MLYFSRYMNCHPTYHIFLCIYFVSYLSFPTRLLTFISFPYISQCQACNSHSINSHWMNDLMDHEAAVSKTLTLNIKKKNGLCQSSHGSWHLSTRETQSERQEAKQHKTGELLRGLKIIWVQVLLNRQRTSPIFQWPLRQSPIFVWHYHTSLK